MNPTSVHALYFVPRCLRPGVWFRRVDGPEMAWRQLQANRHRALAQERHINEPALEDHDWDSRGFRSHCWTKTVKAIAGAGFLALFLSMFNWWAWFASGPWMVKIIVSLFDLWLAFACWQVVMTFSRAVRFGDSRIEFAHFPYRANESIVVRWLTPPGVTRANKGNFTLRCVREFYETTGTGSNRTRRIVHEEQWDYAWSLEQPENFPPGKNIELEFQPPAGLPATYRAGRKPCIGNLR